VDVNDRFCAHFLLSIGDDNHIPLNLATFVHDLCQMVRKRSDIPVELDDIGFTIEAGTICGYVQWRTGWLRSILDWTRSIGDLWLTDLYGPVYYETNALIVSYDALKAWHRLVVAAHSWVLFLLEVLHSTQTSPYRDLTIPA
jgi:hypothetical protein